MLGSLSRESELSCCCSTESTDQFQVGPALERRLLTMADHPPPSPPAQAPSAAPASGPAPAIHRPMAAAIADRVTDAAPASSSREGYAYPYPPPFPGPPFGHGPWAEHHGPPWHGRHHKHHMGHGHHSHHGRPPRPDFDMSSYSMYWEAPPGWHSHPGPPPPFHPPRPPHPYAAAAFHHPPWGPPGTSVPGPSSRTAESTDPTEASTAGEQSSVGAPPDAGRHPSHLRPLKPRKGHSSAPADSSSLARTPSLVAEIVSRVTQSLLASAGANAAKTGGGQDAAAAGAAALGGAGPARAVVLSIPEELLQSIHQLQEGLRARGAASGPDSEAAKLLAQQKRRLRKGKLGKASSLHKRTLSQLTADGPAASSDTAAQSTQEAAPSTGPPSQTPEVGSAALAASAPSVAPSPAFSMPPPASSLPVLPPGSSTASLERRLVPLAPAPGGAASQSMAPSGGGGSAMVVDLRPKKKRGPPARQPKDAAVSTGSSGALQMSGCQDGFNSSNMRKRP